MTEVTDKYGKRVTRPNGVLHDGDRLTVNMTMMDAADPALAHAAAVADAIKRAEVFDMKLHPQTPRYGTRDAALDSAREARDAKMRDAWKQPTSINATATETVAVVGPMAPKEQLFAARDAAVAARDKLLESAWAK